MQSRTWSVTERFRRLWVIAPEMAGSGLPRRRRLALIAVRPSVWRPDCHATDALVVLDANENKIPHASREFGEACERLNPLELPLGLYARLQLLGSLVLPRRVHQVAAALVVASSLERKLPHGVRCALYNPYHLLQYAIADRILIEKVFHLVPEYPRLANVQQAFACSAAHEILGYNPLQQRLTIQPHTVIDERAVIRVYLTQILGLGHRREEAALLDFVRWLRVREYTPIEIFLHYLDRDIKETDPRASKLFDEFGDLVRRDNSLDALSARQVSVSGSSSIGYDLLSSDICHLMVFDNDSDEIPRSGVVWKELSAWRATRCDAVSFDAPYLDWLRALRAADAECFQAVFKRSPEDVAAPIGSGS